MKSQNGVTLTSLVIYIVLIFITIAILTVIISSFQGNIKENYEQGTNNSEIDKFNVYFLKEVKRQGNSINTRYDNEILFTTGNKYTFRSDACIYLNDNIKIAENIEKCVFSETVENGKIIIIVTIKAVNGEEKNIQYVLNNETDIVDGYDEENNYTNYIPENWDTSKLNSNTPIHFEIINNEAYIAPIPKNFEISTKDGENSIEKGLVIVDNDGNEFVWIPVETTPTPYGLNSGSRREPDVITGVTPSDTVDSASGEIYDAEVANLKKAGVTDLVQNDGDEEEQIDAYDFKKQLENEFDLMAASIDVYKGFYVGKYEVSISADNTAQSKGSTAETPIYSATNATTSADSWYGLYALCKKYTNGNVKSTMIWGSQYDAMIEWLGTDAENFDMDKRNTDTERRTGYSNTDVIRNIYDLGGNSFEWTLETWTDRSRTARGGYYINGYPISHIGGGWPDSTNGGNGSRLTLYIE